MALDLPISFWPRIFLRHWHRKSTPDISAFKRNAQACIRSSDSLTPLQVINNEGPSRRLDWISWWQYLPTMKINYTIIRKNQGDQTTFLLKINWNLIWGEFYCNWRYGNNAMMSLFSFLHEGFFFNSGGICKQLFSVLVARKVVLFRWLDWIS